MAITSCLALDPLLGLKQLDLPPFELSLFGTEYLWNPHE